MKRPSQTALRAALLLLGAMAAAIASPANAFALWTDIAADAIPATGERLIQPDRFRAVALDVEEMRARLSLTPLEGTAAAASREVLELPLPAGGLGRFAIVESPVMAPELGARYPEIRTYAGLGLDDPSATARLDLTPAGFHAIILATGGTVYIDPFQRGDVVHYQSYFKADHTPDKSLGGCTVVDEDGMAEEIRRLVGSGGARSGGTLRTYRTAVAATGEYTAFHGGTVPAGLAAVVTSMNRVGAIYERDLAIRMVLVANNDLIIYTNAGTDPYTNNSGGTMLSQNQANLDAVIGSANYDLGHVFSTGGGGIAGLGVACRAGQKARGVTGLGAPVGDNFDIDYVAHEIGHQFGANHSFNGSAGSCSGGNRNASTAYEPGSGSTILAYAGICGGQNLQAHSDDYFHWISIQEAVAYTNSGPGNNCPVQTATGVVDPIVEAGTGGFTIPLGTPFVLTATASTTGTPNFCWEQSDLGPAGHPNTPSGNAPIFRSFDPIAETSRTFPRLNNIINNTQQIGEILPSYARNLTFKVTVRDVQGGGVGVANDGIAFAVASAGPFLVTAPNTAVTWAAGSQQAVSWDVAGTNIAPVSCAAVNIRLSIDGGLTFPTVLAAATPNDGTEPVFVPNLPTTQARIKVEAADNVFFDMSNADFTIEESSAAPEAADGAGRAAGLELYANQPNPFTPETSIRFRLPQSGEVALRVYDPAGRLVRTLVEGRLEAGAHAAVWDGTDGRGEGVSSGVYLYRLVALGETLSGRMTIIR